MAAALYVGSVHAQQTTGGILPSAEAWYLVANHPYRVTVINGEFDYVVGPRGSPLWKRLAATRAPELDVVVIPEAGHIVWSDAPNEFRIALRTALTPG